MAYEKKRDSEKHSNYVYTYICTNSHSLSMPPLHCSLRVCIIHECPYKPLTLVRNSGEKRDEKDIPDLKAHGRKITISELLYTSRLAAFHCILTLFPLPYGLLWGKKWQNYCCRWIFPTSRRSSDYELCLVVQKCCGNTFGGSGESE